MIRSQSDYYQQLQSLLPVGDAWPRNNNSVLAMLLMALSAELGRNDGRCFDILQEADPSTTVELIANCEAWAGLPSRCMAGIAQTLSDRRSALIDRLTDSGGQRPYDYVALAAKFGATIMITEYSAWRCNMPCNLSINGVQWNFVWAVNMPANTANIRAFSVSSPANQPLRSWGNELIECIIRHRAPAHTQVNFIYPS